MKTPVVVRKQYVMYLEFFNDYLWFHTDIHKWTSKIKREFIEDLKTLQSLLPIPIIALVKDNDTKLAKFGTTLGWTKGNTIMLNNGSTAHIYSWSK